MKKQKIISVILAIFLLCSTFSISCYAQSNEKTKTDIGAKATDNKISTRVSVKTVKISAAEPINYIYIIFWDEPIDFTLTTSEKSSDFQGKYLHRLISLPEDMNSGEITLEFKETANISEFQLISDKELPEGVQNWEDNNTLADLLLFSTHADDEQLFFAGVLPLYATNENCEVQVVYFTDHNNHILRRHELLNGLWTVGVTRYPVISPFPDAYSESYEGALSNLERAGFTEDDALAFQVEQIRKFKPLVILGHDLLGEYGHGQHILNAELLTRAVEDAADSAKFSDSAALYGAYDTPKLYLHLYKENELILDLDTPIEGLGKTPFQLSQAGYKCHSTQQGYWFTEWINGKNGQITKASQIKNYSPCKFGLYRTTVGEDVIKTDLFENVTMRSLVPKPVPKPTPTPNPTPTEPTPTPSKKTQSKTPIIITIAAIAIISLAAVFFITTRKKGKHTK